MQSGLVSRGHQKERQNKLGVGRNDLLARFGRTTMAKAIVAAAVLCSLAGCGGGNSTPSPSNPTQQGLGPPPAPTQINSYFGTTGDIWTTKINHTANQINGEDTTLNGVLLAGSIIGNFTPDNGFLNLQLTTVPSQFTGQTGGFALDIPGRAALVRYGDRTYPVIPLAPTNVCPTIGGTVTYQYITIPSAASSGTSTWVPATDTTYGTFQVVTSGANWNFSNITQFTLTGGAPANSGSGLPTGFCGIGTTGYAVTVSSGATQPPVATVTMGFGPSGFFLEDNGSTQAQPVGVVPSNALGAGVGAIGVLQPSSALDTSAVVGAKYLGFYYEPGIVGGAPVAQLASFGCTGTACPAPPTNTSIIGGVFPNDDPAQPANQDVTLELGSQAASSNGLYPSATVTLSGVTFPGVAIAGTLEGKYVIFLIAEDTVNGVPLAIYLFQQ